MEFDTRHEDGQQFRPGYASTKTNITQTKFVNKAKLSEKRQ